MEENHAVLRLSQLLPQGIRMDVLKTLTRDLGSAELARCLGCSQSTIEGWLNGDCPNDEATSRILVLALRRSDEAMALLTKFFDEVEMALEKLKLVEKRRKMDRLVEELDERSRRIAQYLAVRGHAGIRELSDLIEAPSDMDVLIRLRKVINPRAKEIFGEPFVNFEKCKIDPLTGEKILFNWWLSDGLIESLSPSDLLLDIFDEGNYLKVVAHMPSKDWADIDIEVRDGFLTISAKGYYEKIPLLIPVESVAEETYINGVLELKLKKMV